MGLEVVSVSFYSEYLHNILVYRFRNILQFDKSFFLAPLSRSNLEVYTNNSVVAFSFYWNSKFLCSNSKPRKPQMFLTDTSSEMLLRMAIELGRCYLLVCISHCKINLIKWCVHVVCISLLLHGTLILNFFFFMNEILSEFITRPC